MDVDESALLAGERPALMATFVERSAAENTPYLSILSSLYFFQVRSQPSRWSEFGGGGHLINASVL